MTDQTPGRLSECFAYEFEFVSMKSRFCPQEKSRFDLDTIEEWYRSLPSRKRQDTPVKELLSLLDVGDRQAQKIVSVIKCADQAPWLLDAYGQGVITLDQAALIAHFSEDNRAMLGKTYEASGKIPKEAIDFFRKKIKTDYKTLKILPQRLKQA